jgi:hypothetical protein
LGKSTVGNALRALGLQGKTEKKRIARNSHEYRLATKKPEVITPAMLKPTSQVMREISVRKRQKSQSGTGIITPPREPQPFKPLVRRDFYEAQRLAELTR